MNYRHAYHAGNFADVLKHVVLALVIDYLKRKDAPFRVIDTHAGIGRYALTSSEAAKTGEWRQGIGRLIGADAEQLPSEVAQAMAPYLDAVRAANAPGELAVYPGSPLIARHLMRASDLLVANELHPEDAAALRATLGRDRRIKLITLDAWTALKSLLPPKERRGVVLIDPPFEEEGELARMVEGLDQALRRFRTGVYLAWYPIKDRKPIERFHADLASRCLAGAADSRADDPEGDHCRSSQRLRADRCQPALFARHAAGNAFSPSFRAAWRLVRVLGTASIVWSLQSAASQARRLARGCSRLSADLPCTDHVNNGYSKLNSGGPSDPV